MVNIFHYLLQNMTGFGNISYSPQYRAITCDWGRQYPSITFITNGSKSLSIFAIYIISKIIFVPPAFESWAMTLMNEVFRHTVILRRIQNYIPKMCCACSFINISRCFQITYDGLHHKK